MWSRKAILYPLVSFGAYNQRLKRHYYTGSTSNRMPGPGAQTSTYHGLCCLLGPLGPGVEIFKNLPLWTYFSASDGCTVPSQRQSPPTFTLNRRETRQNRRYEDGDGKGGGVPTSSPSALQNVCPVVEVHDESIYRRSIYVESFLQSICFLCTVMRGFLSRQRG